MVITFSCLNVAAKDRCVRNWRAESHEPAKSKITTTSEQPVERIDYADE